MARNVHLVGSVPMANSEQVFEAVGTALGRRIKRIPDGETGKRGDWITWLEPVFAASPALQKSGEFFRVHATGTGRERYTLKPGCKPEDVHFENLHYADFAKESFAVLGRSRLFSILGVMLSVCVAKESCLLFRISNFSSTIIQMLNVFVAKKACAYFGTSGRKPSA